MSDLDNNDQPESFMDRIKESPRTVSALIIILIVAAAIYAFSGDKNRTASTTNDNQATDQSTDQAATTDQATTSPVVSPSPAASKAPAVAGATATPVSQSELSDKAKALPAAQTENNAYIETAQRGDGLTHLARRAATRYLADHQAGYELTQAHRIYIEDYIQKKMGSGHLSLGAQKTISYDLIKEAVDHAGQLNAQQLHHLERYTPALT